MPPEGSAAPPGRQRLDRWLFFSRAVKSRTLAQKLIGAGHVRVNSARVVAPDRLVGPGDTLTMTLNQRLRVWRIVDAGRRRGPAAEAESLYEDLSPQVTGPEMAFRSSADRRKPLPSRALAGSRKTR